MPKSEFLFRCYLSQRVLVPSACEGRTATLWKELQAIGKGIFEEPTQSLPSVSENIVLEAITYSDGTEWPWPKYLIHKKKPSDSC